MKGGLRGFSCIALLVALHLVGTPCSAAQQAIVVETSDVVFDGQPAGHIKAGTTVEILGEKEADGMSLIRFESPDGQSLMGLVRTGALVKRKGSPTTTAPANDPSSAPAEDEPPASLDTNEPLSATDLAEYLKANRDQFSELAGRSIKVNGVVESLRVVGKVGSMLTAEISLKTRPDLPKVRLLVHASEFMEDAAGDRFEMRVQDKTLEGRSRDTRNPYKYWYWYNGYWRSRSVARSEWVPIISVGHPVNGSGVLGKYHIHVDVDGAKIDKG
jgi:hypothetical protein